MNILHSINPGATVTGNVKESWQKMRFNLDYRVDFTELVNHHAKFPQVFQPAFALHRDFQHAFFGTFKFSFSVSLRKYSYFYWFPF